MNLDVDLNDDSKHYSLLILKAKKYSKFKSK